jgi:hypothetical protein
MTCDETDKLRVRLLECLSSVTKEIGSIQIGTRDQFPFGWRKAAKGRTVWRILEEAINQNLEITFRDYGMSLMEASASEVSVYDSHVRFRGIDADLYLNVKSAVLGGRTNKDDISKAIGLRQFFEEDINRQLFVCTFVIEFLDDMSIRFTDTHVMPIAWLPDIYVNPSNNGNLQSAKYKDVSSATRRSNQEFLEELVKNIDLAHSKSVMKRGKKS